MNWSVIGYQIPSYGMTFFGLQGGGRKWNMRSVNSNYDSQSGGRGPLISRETVRMPSCELY
jgi:hypothetical protein